MARIPLFDEPGGAAPDPFVRSMAAGRNCGKIVAVKLLTLRNGLNKNKKFGGAGTNRSLGSGVSRAMSRAPARTERNC
jgi:hypothetical protein